MSEKQEFIIAPNPEDQTLSTSVSGIDHTGEKVDTRVVHERALTLYLNSQEVVTMMTIGDHPDLLAIGYLVNQNMKKKVRTSGCAQGTVFGDIMDSFENVTLDKSSKLKTSWLYELTKKINTVPSLYLEAGAIHGCVLCQENRPLVYMEDVGRHNAVDKIAGWMFQNQTDATDNRA